MIVASNLTSTVCLEVHPSKLMGQKAVIIHSLLPDNWFALI